MCDTMSITESLVTASVPARMTTMALAIYCVIQGGIIVAGGPQRWTGAAYATISLVPGSPYTWGWALAGLGVLVFLYSLLGMWVFKSIGLFCIGVWHFMFASGFVWAALSNSNVGTTPGPIYGFVGILALILILLHEKGGQHAVPPRVEKGDGSTPGTGSESASLLPIPAPEHSVTEHSPGDGPAS